MATSRSTFLVGTDTALAEGEFFTDPYGKYILPSTDPAAARRYVEPGIALGSFENATANRIERISTDPWIFDHAWHEIGGDGNLAHVPHVPNTNIEESLRTN